MDDITSNRLRVRRAEVRITQERLARRLSERTGRHWSQVRVHRIETEIQTATPDERLELAAALNTTVDELFPQPSAEVAS